MANDKPADPTWLLKVGALLGAVAQEWAKDVYRSLRKTRPDPPQG